MIIGKEFDNYRILEKIGEGGMGVVFKAEHTTLKKRVALKMLHPVFAHDKLFLDKFQQEAEILANLEDDNIVSVTDYRETEFGSFIVMQYVDGTTLDELVNKEGPIPFDRAVGIFKQILRAVRHAHGASVIHRDIKPKNIMLNANGIVKVTDFGLAKLQHGSESTVTQTKGGTLFYMSPEQLRGLANVDKRSDIYSLGMTLYKILAGRLPFYETDSDYAVQETILKGKLPEPSKFKSNIPQALCKIIMKAIEKNPAKRFQSAYDMLQAIEDFEEAESSESKVSNGQNKLKRYIFITFSSILALVLLIMAFRVKFSPKEITQGNDEPKGESPPIRVFPEVPSHIGSLSITSIPSGAIVWIDEEEVGTTPYQNDYREAGQHSIRIELTGYEVWERYDVLVGAGENDPIEAVLTRKPLPMATLILLALPRGSVSVDNTISRNADLPTVIQVNAGEHTVEFQHPSYGSKKIIVNVHAGQRQQLTCYFESYVNIQSLDAETSEALWGTIRIDGIDIGTTPRSEYPLGPGEHEVVVMRSGYETVESIQRIVIEPTLKKRVHNFVFHLRKL